jgi:hypothetical protein
LFVYVHWDSSCILSLVHLGQVASQDYPSREAALFILAPLPSEAAGARVHPLG